MKSYQKSWNKRQTELRQTLLRVDKHREAIQLFSHQHAMLHSWRMAQTEPWSYEDEVLDGMTEGQIRRIPQNDEHSVVWLIWHIARIEDVAMNMLVAGQAQILRQDNWLERINITACDTGNLMAKERVVDLSARIDIGALRDYRMDVGRRTREIVKDLQPQDLKQKVDPSRLERVLDEGAVVREASGLIAYWGRRNIAGLLLMPATRHNFIHLNEAARIKRRRQ